MMQRIRKIRVVDAGFTLIELLIVVVILGVLAGVVVFAVQAFNNEGVTAACKADVKSVETASEAFYAKTGAYDITADPMQDLVDKFYLKEKPNSTKYTVNWTSHGANTSPDINSATCP